VGIVVPRHRQTAVDRNRLKRRIRELVRIDLLPALKARPAVDVVIRARVEAYAAGFTALRADILTVQRRLGGDFAGSKPAE
jgi:ribonuclease P protein component